MSYICTTKHTFISYLSCCFGKMPNKRQYKDRRAYSGSQLEGILSFVVGKAWGQEQEAGSSHCICSLEAGSEQSIESWSIKSQGSSSVIHCQQQGSPLKVSTAFQNRDFNLEPNVQTLEHMERQKGFHR